MKSVSIDDLKRDVSQLDAFVEGDESIHLVSHGRTVAVLTPIPPTSTLKPVQWPDYAQRMRDIFGDRVLPAGTIQALIDEDRGER